MWQEIFTGIVLAGAVFYLFKKLFMSDKSKSGCGTCATGEIKEGEKRA